MKFKNPQAPRAQRLLPCLLLSLVYSLTLFATPFNALNFDGVDDRFIIPITGTSLEDAQTFSIEFWFRAEVEATVPDCLSGPRGIALLSGEAGSRVGVGICDGEVRAYFRNFFLSSPPLEMVIGPATPGQWQVLRISYFEGDMSFTLDCTPAVVQSFQLGLQTIPPAPMAGLKGFSIGGDLAATQLPSSTNFLGQVDQLQLYEGLSRAVPSGMCLTEYCVPDATSTSAVFYYDFNQSGAAAGAVGGVGAVENRTVAPGGNGNLSGFDLTDYSTVFVPSTAPLLGEGLSGLPFEIRDYPNRNGVLTEICSGDPVHFCLGPNGPPAHLMQQASIVWEFSDDGGASWTDLLAPPFTDYCFPILPGVLTVDCTNNPIGYVDRLFRARMSVDAPALGQSCDYLSETDTLRIRCPLADVTIDLTPDNPACAGDVIDFSVDLITSHSWLLNGSTGIIWSFAGPGVQETLPDTAPAVTYQFIAPAIAQTSQYCFTASITDCNGPSTFSACISVDPEPDAGTIVGLPFSNPRNLSLVSGNPNPVYDICPGEDATLGEGIASLNCRTQWQYTFDDPFTTGNLTWTDMGTTNTVQNTNILPSHLWPNGATNIYYRYRCDPLSDPSGCEPDFSDTLEIRLIPDPLPVTLTGPATFCTGNFFQMTFQGTVSGVTYEWFRNGVSFGLQGTSYVEFRGGNYCVVADNGCVRVKGPVLTVEECDVIAAISCPLLPNDCVNPGDDVTVEAIATYTCDDQAPLTYEWFVDGVLAGTAPQLTYTADPATNPVVATEIKLIVTGPTPDCTATVERTIVPCGNRY